LKKNPISAAATPGGTAFAPVRWMHATSMAPGLDIAFFTNREASNTEPHELGMDEIPQGQALSAAQPARAPAVTITHVKASL